MSADIAWLGPSANGQINEIKGPPIPDNQPAVIPQALQGEHGSQWGQDRLFSFYEQGVVFMRGPIQDRELDNMLRRDGKARSIEQVLTLPIRGAQWHLDAAPDDRGQTAFVEDMLLNPAATGGMVTPISTVIGQLTTGTLFRHAYFEKVFKPCDDGKVRYDNIAFRPSPTCYMARSSKTAKVLGFLNWTWIDMQYTKVFVPNSKGVVYIHGMHRDPIMGTSDLEVTYRAFDTKQKLRFLWSQFLENQTIPKAIATKQENDPQGAQDLAKKVATLKGGGVIGLTSGETVAPFESNGQGAATFQAAINYLDSEMTSSVLASFLDLAQAASARGGGSFALSLSQTDFFLQSRQGVLTEIAAVISEQIIAPMVRWNFGADVAPPKFVFTQLAATGNTVENTIAMLQTLAALPPKPGDAPILPQEFVDELVNQVAGLLDLNVSKVAGAVRDRTAALAQISPGMASQAPLAAVADIGTALVKGATGGSTRTVPGAGRAAPGIRLPA